MSKVKKQLSDKYELLYIINNTLSESEIGEITKKVDNILEKNNAKITETKHWGKRKLAYEIDHNAYGYYILTVFDAEKKDLAAINRLLNQARELLRYNVIKYIEPYTIKELAQNETKAEETKDKKEPKNKKEKQVKNPENTEEEDKKLNKKLDNILEAKDLF